MYNRIATDLPFVGAIVEGGLVLLGQREHGAAGVVGVCDAEHAVVEALVEDGLKEKEGRKEERYRVAHIQGWLGSRVSSGQGSDRSKL